MSCSRAADVPFLVQVLTTFVERRASRDLLALLRPLLEEQSWKTAPRLAALVQYADLAADLCAKALQYVSTLKKTV